MLDIDRIMADAPTSVGGMLARRAHRSGRHEAFRHRVDGRWASMSWTEAKRQVDLLAAGLLSLGLGYEDRVAVASATRVEWILLDLAVNSAAGATTTIYPNTGPDEFAHILSHSGSRIFVGENAGQWAKAAQDPELAAQVRHVILIDGEDPEDPKVISWAALLEIGKRMLALDPECVTRAIASCSHDTLATLIYTSGTTGSPKGVELTHRSWVYEGEALRAMKFLEPSALQFLWLPLSHVFGKCLIAAQLSIGFATAVDGRADQIVTGLGETHPDIMCGVPRVFEKVRNTVMTSAPRGALKDRISRWAFAVGRDSRPYRMAGRRMPVGLAAQYALAQRLVFAKLQTKMGGNIDFFISGSAKLPAQVQEWFYSAGILLVEGYGMTETAAVSCFNNPARPRFGTVGPAIPGTEVRIAGDGEILIKGPGVMRGYHKDPKLTAEVLQDGWLSTGDIGHLDHEGCLIITDRKKDLMKTSGGKYVAPQKVENAVAANVPYVSQVVAIGDGRKYVSAILTLDPAALDRWAKNHKIEGVPYAELTQLPEVRVTLDRFLTRANARLEPWESIKRYAVLDHEFSVDDGTTTPSMKVRRAVITDQYAEVVASLYDVEGD